jgi:hypothetical protein
MDQDAITQKRRDVRHLDTELAQLQDELDGLQGGPDYYEKKQLLLGRIEDARHKRNRARQELQQLQHGTQARLL